MEHDIGTRDVLANIQIGDVIEVSQNLGNGDTFPASKVAR